MADEAMPHVLLFPFPALGHVRAMLKLAELLSTANLYITFVNTESVHRLLLSSFDFSQPKLRFRTIPDGLPEDHPRSLLHFLELEESLRTQSRGYYRKLLVPSNGDEPDGWPLVTCVVADGPLPLAFEVAKEMEIPVIFVVTGSPSSILSYFSIPELIKRGEIPFPEEANMDELIRGVPGMESFLRRRDLPSFFRKAKSIDDPILRYRITINNNLAQGAALILNTAESIDSLVLPHIRSICPLTYTLGPLHILHKDIKCGRPSSLENQLQDDRSCIVWLDSQPKKSVVYVSFGSIAVVSKEELIEFWHGLVNSGKRFLWVIRADMLGGANLSEMIPPELEEGTRERAFLVEWSPQEEVLAHPAVGCFLTHSGWNSTLESIIAGVPMICWPFFSDQQINSRFVSEVWKIGVDMKDFHGRNVVEAMVRQVMDGEKADELRRSAIEMAQMVKKSTEEEGSSYTNFKKLVEHIKLLSS